jgi:hypothetical protein
MWIRYTTVASFIALCVAFGASLLVGWSLAGQVPGLRGAEHMTSLARGLALAVIAWPIWFIHWRWARRDWLWESSTAQYYLAFFTICGLIACAVIGAQFIARFLEVLLGTQPLNDDTSGFLLGALWSTLFSLWLWVYHGRIWLSHRRRLETRD